MPGTEYQFRLRAYSNGSWQAKEESIVSSPFKTICSPPDPPPACPRARQLGSDPLVVGGLPDTGALLSVKTAEISCRGRRSCSGDGGGGDIDVKTSTKTLSGVGRKASAAAAAASAAAISRGKARAETEAEWTNGRGSTGLGGVIKSGLGDDDNDDDKGDRNDHDTHVEGNDEGEADAAVDDYESRKPHDSSDGRRGEQWERRREPCSKEEEDKEEEQTQEIRMGHKHTRRRRSSDHDAQGPREPPLLLPALTHNGGGQAEEGLSKKCDHEEEDKPAAVAEESDAKGSTTMVLEWDSGCTNGAITTNYEVSDEVLKEKSFLLLVGAVPRRLKEKKGSCPPRSSIEIQRFKLKPRIIDGHNCESKYPSSFSVTGCTLHLTP